MIPPMGEDALRAIRRHNELRECVSGRCRLRVERRAPRGLAWPTMGRRRGVMGQATVEAVSMWALLATLLVTVGALVAREVAVEPPHRDGLARVAEELRAGATMLDAHADQPSAFPGIAARLAGGVRDAVRFRASVDREFGAGFVDRLRRRGRQALRDPVLFIEELLSPGPRPEDPPSILGPSADGFRGARDLARYADRLLQTNPADAARALSRDLGGLTADELLRRVLRAGGRRVVRRERRPGESPARGDAGARRVTQP